MTDTRILTLAIFGLSLVVIAPALAQAQPTPLTETRLSMRPVAKAPRPRARPNPKVAVRLMQGKMVVVTLRGGRELRGRLLDVTAKAIELNPLFRRPIKLAWADLRQVRRFTQPETDAWLLRNSKLPIRDLTGKSPHPGIGAGGVVLIVLGVTALVGGVVMIALLATADWSNMVDMGGGDSDAYSRVLKRSRSRSRSRSRRRHRRSRRGIAPTARGLSFSF